MKTLISIKTEKVLKERAKQVAAELGLSLSDVINESLRQLVKNCEVTFSTAPRMTPELEAIIKEAEHDLAEGKNMSPAFSSMKDAIRYLHSAKK